MTPFPFCRQCRFTEPDRVVHVGQHFSEPVANPKLLKH
jgi:hypothetical protein